MLLGSSAPRISLADRGVALSTGSITIGDPLTPGGRYALPLIHVRNPGDEPGEYRMSITAIEQPARGDPPDPAWVRFEPRAFALEASRSQPVEVTIVLPPSAGSGEYAGLLLASLAGEDGEAAVGGGAAAELSFRVRSAGLLEAWANRVSSWLRGAAPWSYAVLALLVVGSALAAASRRFSVRIERRD